jgi:hypothetical protein
MKRKAEEGHCRNHRNTESGIPCKLSSEFHNEIYWEIVQSLEDIMMSSSLCSAIFHIQKGLLRNTSSALDSCAVSKVTLF